MRVYIIANDGITLCHEIPATMSQGEIAVASNEELHAAALNGKRLLALWNALPGVEKRRKVGDRGALIDQLWSAIEALPEPEPPSEAKRPSKQNAVIAMLRRPEGATVDEVAGATGWQRHTVRGVFSGTLKKKLGLSVNPVFSAYGAVVTNIAHIPAALTAVMRENGAGPDFATEGSLALKPWFGSNQGLELPPELDIPVVEAIPPYSEQITQLEKHIGAVFPRQSMRIQSIAK